MVPAPTLYTTIQALLENHKFFSGKPRQHIISLEPLEDGNLSQAPPPHCKFVWGPREEHIYSRDLPQEHRFC
jgi:hypothetical protein